MSTVSHIYNHDVPELVDSLIKFLGRSSVERELKRYRKAVKSSKQFYREEIVKKQHPWWKCLDEYLIKIERKDFPHGRLPREVGKLAADALAVTSVARQIKNPEFGHRIRRNLIDSRYAKYYLFEINFAYHLITLGFSLEWYPDTMPDRHGEFKACRDDISLNVECKCLDIDNSCSVKFTSLCQLADDLSQKLCKSGRCGIIALDLKKPLPTAYKGREELVNELFNILQYSDQFNFSEFSFGSVRYLILRRGNITPELIKLVQASIENLPSNAAVVGEFSRDDLSKDAFLLSAAAVDQRSLLTAIRSKLSRAINNQLTRNMPGIVVCYIPEVHSFRGLAGPSGLAAMTQSLFSQKNGHLVGIAYTSDERYYPADGGYGMNHESLYFPNPWCKFPAALKLRLFQDSE